MSQSWKRLVVLATVLAAASCLLSAVLFARLDSTTKHTRASLCTFRSDVEQRLHNGEKFLRDHPQGIPGIPAATLRQSFVAQRRTVKALSGLDCPNPS